MTRPDPFGGRLVCGASLFSDVRYLRERHLSDTYAQAELAAYMVAMGRVPETRASCPHPRKVEQFTYRGASSERGRRILADSAV